MATDTLAVVMRMAERSLIVLGGILAIFLGYRLFYLGIDKNQGEAVAFGISLKNFGPGLFFAALGAFVLITSMRASIKTGSPEAAPPAPTPPVATAPATAAPKAHESGTFFFGIEDPKRNLKLWSAKSFFIETREFLRRLKQGSNEEELNMLKDNLQEKLDSITMSDEEYGRYKELTNKIPLGPDEEKELSSLEVKIFP